MVGALTLPAQLVTGDKPSGRHAPQKPMNEIEFEAFYRKTAGSLWSYIYRLTGDASTADDLLQKTFFRFLRSNPTLTGEEHMRRYIFRTATNLALDYFRETKRERNRDAEVSAKSETMSERHELRHDMKRMFGRSVSFASSLFFKPSMICSSRSSSITKWLSPPDAISATRSAPPQSSIAFASSLPNW